MTTRTPSHGAHGHPENRHTRLLRPGLVALAILLAGAAACDDDGITVPGDAPAQEGIIVAVDADPFAAASAAPAPVGFQVRTEIARTIWVKEDPDQPCGIVWTFDAGTDVLVREGSALRRATDDDLLVDRPVRVWTDGAIAESCPAQGTATAVELR